MKILLWGEYTRTTPRVQNRLALMGYEALAFGERQRAGVLSEQKRRTVLLRLLADAEAVYVTAGELDAAALARLAVVCEFAGRPLLVGDLPAHAPDTVEELRAYAEQRPVRCTWMREEAPAPVVEPAVGQKMKLVLALQRMKKRVLAFEEYVNNHIGDGLKNPRAREQQRPPVRYPENTALSRTG